MSPLRPTVTCLAAAAFALAGCGEGERIRTERPILRHDAVLVDRQSQDRPGLANVVALAAACGGESGGGEAGGGKA